MTFFLIKGCTDTFRQATRSGNGLRGEGMGRE
ncbi:hypothetical protein HNP84_007020 [Thermocatellispora tengchongensis]|uniref:Uncharacterized protein n=1 Tax=Thermocatellispora tengchongensis TaxID=1073253 RepID=A0A840PCB1_9ACTN|nr:hypothetical protein [Thermocatellispora tengchongensis]